MSPEDLFAFVLIWEFNVKHGFYYWHSTHLFSNKTFSKENEGVQCSEFCVDFTKFTQSV